MKLDNIEKQFKDTSIIHHNIFLFRPYDALAVIEKCRSLNKKIYGIDAFNLFENGKIQPVMEQSIDYTSKGYEYFDEFKYYSNYHIRKNCDVGHWDEAEQFIKDRINDKWVFEIVYEKFE